MEYQINGRKKYGCGILLHEAFLKVQEKRGGCCMRNCPFYKEERDQIRCDIGIYNMTNKQKIERDRYYKQNYKGEQNIRKYE